MKPSLRLFCLSLVGIFSFQAVVAAEFHVATGGNDNNSGAAARPFATLGRARMAARAAVKPVTVWLHGGTYYLPETLVLGAEDSGVTWQAAAKETPVISGGARLDLKWEPYRDGISQAKVPAGFSTDQIFVNGKLEPMARYPNFDAKVAIFNGYAGDAISAERVAKWADPAGGFLHAMHVAKWGGYHYRITGKDAKGEVTLEGGWQNNRPMGMHRDFRFVENIFEELDAPGEWFLDGKTGTLYLYPEAGTDLAKAVVEGVRLRHLVEFRGAKSITMSGLTFRHAARTFMDNKEPMLRTDWTVYRGGALFFNGCENCTINACHIDRVGGNAVFVNNRNRHITVSGCHIEGAGGNGIAFVGDPQAVRNGIGWKDKNDYAAIDKTPGPKSDNYPAECLVDDCLIHGTGRIEKQTAGVEIDMSQGITVRSCSIYGVPRAGINIGDGCWGGHVIEYCDIFDTVRETGDHGSFNSWGRDRFWDLKNAPADELPKLAMLDVVKPMVLRNNRWRCDHGWDVDLDDGSSNYEIHDNLFLSGGLKLREGFHRKVWNNIGVRCGFHPHVWFANCGDEVTGNIWMDEYRPAGGMPGGRWGKEVDRNLFPTEAARTKFAAHGCDVGSLAGDPMFVDAAHGDFRVKQGSPALKIGFKNFAMDRFGVRSAELRKIARVPSFAAGKEEVSERDGTVRDWLGVKVKNIKGLGEVSAYGTSGESGVLVMDVPASHAFAAAGLRKGDVILGVNGKAVTEAGELLKETKPASLDVRRNQASVTVRIGGGK